MQVTVGSWRREVRQGCETVLDNKEAVGRACGVYCVCLRKRLRWLGELGKGGVGGVTSVLGPPPKESDKYHTDWPEAWTPFKNCHRRGEEVFEGRLGQLGKHG